MVESVIIAVALGYLTNFIYDLSKAPFSGRVRTFRRKKSVENISNFYSDDDQIKRGCRVSITGTFSKYIPILPGKASLKRDLHLEFRNNIEKIKSLFEAKNHRLQSTTINYLMSVSAGQMVVLPSSLADALFVPCAIYESIVRNSIILLIENELYEKISKVIARKSVNPNFVEARIEGIVEEKENTFAKKMQGILYNIRGVREAIETDKLEALNKTKVIYMLNNKSKFRILGPPRFLDGDIWTSIESKVDEELITRFLNLSDQEELAAQTKDMLEEYKIKFSDWRITGSFDSSAIPIDSKEST